MRERPSATRARRRWRSCWPAALLVLAIGPARAQAPEPAPAALVLGTATPGGGFPAYGEAFVAALRAADPTLTVTARPTGGSADNIAMLEAGTLDIGLVQGEPANAALRGEGRPPSGLKVITAMFASPGLLAVRADGPVRSLDDLRGKAVALGTRGSGLTVLGRLVLAGAGIDPERDIELVTLERAGDGPALVESGRVAGLWGGGTGWPGFTALAAAPGGARFIGPSEAAIARIVERTPSLRRLVVPAGTYRGMTDPVATVGSWSLVLARADLDEDLAYRLARSLDRARADLGTRLPQARETGPAETVGAVPAAWLHPGVARHLRETGHLRP